MSWATLTEQYKVGDVVPVSTPDGLGQYAGAFSKSGWTTVRQMRFNLTSTTRWRASQ